MGIMESVGVAIRSVCMAIACKAISTIDMEEAAPVKAEPPADEAEVFYAEHATPQAPDNINGAELSADVDHQLWIAEQQMLRRVRPGSPLIDPDYDALTRDIITPQDIS